ncbi:triose-phosphate transporter family domain containing protein [Rhypophila sp. PSN 637]
MQHSTSTSHAGPSGSTMRANSQARSPNGKPYGCQHPYAPYTDTTASGRLQHSGDTEKFPDFDVGQHVFANGRATSPRRHNINGLGGYGYTNGTTQPSSSDRWHPRRDSRVKWAPANPADRPSPSYGHSRKPSISRAIRHIRSGSMSQNAHELADALRAPISYKLIALCVIWYWSSALTNTSSKSILTAFDKPATLTLIQFAFVSSYCILFSWLASTFPKLRTAVPALKHPLRYPSRDVIVTTLPLAAFQIGGHLLSSTATSKIPVSLVHTIKGLSPLFTVLAYRFIFDIQYPKATYLSLVPLTLGVMLACSGKHSFGGEILGIIYALLATIIFVTQNIFSKKLFNEAKRAEEMGVGAQSRKLDKLNLLCYSSGMAFILTGPIWLWSEGVGIIEDFLWDGSVDLIQAPNSFDHGRLTLEFIFNGTFHFAQNILAFILLSMVSPVTYSVASLIKRVFVVIIAILWFRNPTTNIQGAGIALTFLGLYLYDRSQEKNKADQRARSMTDSKNEESILPLVSIKQVSSDSPAGPSMDPVAPPPFSMPSTNGPALAPPAASVPSAPGNPYAPGPAAASVNGHARQPSQTLQLQQQQPPNQRRLSNASSYEARSETGRTNGRVRGSSNAGWAPPGARQEGKWRYGDNSISVAS